MIVRSTARKTTQMNLRRTLLLAASHSVVAAAGFAAGIYALPILIAPEGPSPEDIKAASSGAMFTGQFITAAKYR
jgi:hypothetical protein